jgi:hypothetical protein
LAKKKVWNEKPDLPTGRQACQLAGNAKKNNINANNVK